jgi:soluble lytic murein transglycosylase-like protein
MAKPRDPSSLPEGRSYSLLGNGTPQPNPRSAPRTPQGLLSYIEALHREANDNPPPSAPRHAPMLAQASTPSPAPVSTSLDEAHRAENRWPVIHAGKENEGIRRRSILENNPALFSIEDDPTANGDAPSYRVPALGAELVRKYDQEIEEEAARTDVDPDLLRAIMYVEVSQGNYGGSAWLADKLGLSGSILPMNVNPQLWSPLINDGKPLRRTLVAAGHSVTRIDPGRAALDDPRLNIRAGALLLKRIQDRLEDPSIRNVATLYNGLGLPAVNNYGAQVEQVYRTREWERPPF